ncbi:related to alcohol dehydrogenase [Rhynchosporium graminicola]|uniref:Related to alcohol dehydrogenase n=1 Tax=Rhynchosporium graminicola TaxID=2792576 RepID=A0A1E1JTA0_9HELO|nr:related to alcohol dehydrogenase [Rhynchosporium commune]
MPEYTIPCKGIVAYTEHDWKLEDILTREPEEDEFLIELPKSRHTDITGYGGIYPRVLGHEGAGPILRVGSAAVGKVCQPGDLVILSAASCQACHYCRTGHPAYCSNHAAITLQANDPNFVLAFDTSKIIGGGFLGQSTFASPTPVKASCASNVTKLSKDAETLTLYAPLGCGIVTGAGAITHVGNCGPEDVVGVVGLGGVGLAGITAAAKYRGVNTIVACDLLPSRIELAMSIERLDFENLQTAIKALTLEGLGCSHILDTSPSVAVMSACMEALQKNGKLLQVGVKPVGAKLELDLLMCMVNGRRPSGVIEGDRDPAEALPELVQWCENGILPVSKMLKHFPVEKFDEARKAMQKGDVIKGVLVW